MKFCYKTCYSFSIERVIWGTVSLCALTRQQMAPDKFYSVLLISLQGFNFISQQSRLKYGRCFTGLWNGRNLPPRSCGIRPSPRAPLSLVSAQRDPLPPHSLLQHPLGPGNGVDRPCAIHRQQADKGETSDSEEKRCNVTFFFFKASPQCVLNK